MDVSEHTMQSWDGHEIFYRAWLPAGKPERAVILFHRGHEHSGRFMEFVEELALEKTACFAWDARGNGHSPGRRDWAEHFGVYAKDADVFARHLAYTYGVPLEDMAVVANSVGAVAAAAWVHDYAPPIRALVLAAPAFRIKLYIPLAIPSLRLGLKLNLMTTVPSYVKSKVLTHDPEQQALIDNDDLITHSISTNILLDVHDTSTRLIQDAGAIRVPTLMLMARHDWVVKKAPQRQFFERLTSTDKRLIEYPDSYHAIFYERDRDRAIADTRDFLAKHLEGQSSRQPLIDADQAGYTRSVYDRLSQPAFAPGMVFQRVGMKTIGRLSKGISLGWKSGFDSGMTLDYVYRNQPAGATPLGRLIDWFYLNSPGWRGIRQRRVHLERMLKETIQRVHSAGQPVHLVDLAAGPGRYILESIKALPDIPVTALLRDYQAVNLEAGRQLAADLGVEGVTFAEGSAFDREDVAAIRPVPTIAIVSGLLELFPENGNPRTALGGLSAAMSPGSYLIYTNQPWHPQLEFIARVLPNREGKPWVMRCRTQEEMDDLVREAGFDKLDMEIDRWGIFSVSLARKRP